MKFLPTFLFESIEVYDPLIRNFRVWASEKLVRVYSPASKLANSRQKCATLRARSKYANAGYS